MVSQKTDRVLMVVGIFLVVAIIGWIAATAVIPAHPTEPGKKQTKFSSTGKSPRESSCCKNKGQVSAGCRAGKAGGCQGQQDCCQKTCSRGGSPSYGRPYQTA